MNKKKVKPKIKEIGYSCLYDKLSDVVEYFKSQGATEKDYKDIEFGLDYSHCYYPDDEPSVAAVWYKKVE